MDNTDRKTNISVKLLEYSGTLTVVGVIVAWFFSINSFNSYFASFFIDASQLVSFSIIWQFASQKLLTLLYTSISVIFLAFFIIFLLKELREKYFPPRQTHQPNIRIKLTLKIFLFMLVLLLTTCLVYLVGISTLLVQGKIGTLRAKIDQERFNNSVIIPHRIIVDEKANIIECVSILGSFDKYTFVIYKDRKAELIKSTRILSIQPMLVPASTIENSVTPSKTLNEELCDKKEKGTKYIITTKPNSSIFNKFWTFVNYILKPNDPF